MHGRSYILLMYLLLGAGLAYAFLPPDEKTVPSRYEETDLLPPASVSSTEIKAPDDCFLLWSLDGISWKKTQSISAWEANPATGRSSLSAIPTSFRWKPSSASLPQVSCLRYAVAREAEEGGRAPWRRSPLRYHAFSVPSNDLPVVLLYINRDDFFSEETGIYVPGHAANFSRAQSFRTKWWDQSANYHQRGKSWERRVHFQYYSPEGNLLYAADAGARIHGNATRAYPQKSLRLTARKEYGTGKFKYDFFGNGLKKYDDLILRNGGNDWDRTLVTDAFIHSYCSKPDGKHPVLVHQDAQFCEVYINGEYWGIHSIRPRVNEDFLAGVFDVKTGKVVMVEGNTITVGDAGDKSEYEELMRTVREKDLSLEQHFLDIEAEINLDGLIDYIAIESFCANTDWPANNVKQFRIKGDHIPGLWQKWNWVLWDMDYAFAYAGEAAVNTNMFERLKASKADVAVLFCRLSENRQFAQYALERMMSMEHLRPERIVPAFKSYAAQIDASINDHILRWRKPSDRQKHLRATERFLEQRYSVWLEQVKAFFKAGGES